MISTTPPAPSTRARGGRSLITTSTTATRLPASASPSTVATRAPSSTTAFPRWATTASTSSAPTASLTTTRFTSRTTSPTLVAAAPAGENGGVRSMPTSSTTRSSTTALVAGIPVWLDNGNSGTLISGNYFYMSYGSAITSETGFDLDVTGNLFMDGGWGKGSGGCANNCDGAVNLNSSGGFNVPGSRYENQVLISKQPVRGQLGGHRHLAGRLPAPARTRARAGPDDTVVLLGRLPEQRFQPPRAGSTTSPMRATAPMAGLPPWRSRPARAVRRSWLPGPARSTTRSASAIPHRRRPQTKRTLLPSPARGRSTPAAPASRLRANFASGRRRPGLTAAEATRAPSFPTREPPRRASPVSRWSEAPGRWQARSRRSSPTRSLPRSATPTTAPSRSLRLWPARRRPEPRSATPVPASSTPRARRSPPGPSLPTAFPTGTAASGRRRTSP